MHDGTTVWEPHMLRTGLFNGLFAAPHVMNGRDLQRRAMGRVRIHALRAQNEGAKRLLISEENMIGAPRACLRAGMLYPAIGERLARLGATFEGRIARVVMTIRAQDIWWSSVAAFGVGRGHAVPDATRLAAFSSAPRTWRDVITDMAFALPETEIRILPFEQFAGRSDAVLSTAIDRPVPYGHAASWLNRSPDTAKLRSTLAQYQGASNALPSHLAQGEGRWNPFTPLQAANLHEAYADDIMWLTAGADGLATLTEDPSRKRAGQSLPSGALTKGQSHDQQNNTCLKGRLAQTG